VKWSLDGRFCATGANDNLVQIWDAINMSNDCLPVSTFSEHQAAVKGIFIDIFQSLLCES